LYDVGVLFVPAIEAEKKEEEFKQSIQGFNRGSLKKADTDVKNPLPTKEGKDTGNPNPHL
jgi:hypothetical protein